MTNNIQTDKNARTVALHSRSVAVTWGVIRLPNDVPIDMSFGAIIHFYLLYFNYFCLTLNTLGAKRRKFTSSVKHFGAR